MNNSRKPAIVLTIDGPSGAGKGTIAKSIAQTKGWHYLDSGALYRVLGVAAIEANVKLEDEAGLARLAESINLEFKQGQDGEWLTLLNNSNVSANLQTEEVGAAASKIAVLTAVRDSLLQKQRSYQQQPGLVADGRDMGSVVFPQAEYKVYLTASAQVRGKRRYKQLKEKGINANLPAVIQDIELRDERDTNRDTSPLIVPEGAIYIDTSEMSIEQAVMEVLDTLIDK